MAATDADLRPAASADEALFAPPRVILEKRPDGAAILRSPLPCRPPARSLGILLDEWAARAPNRPFLRERAAAGGERWRSLTFGEARRLSRAIAQALLERGLSPERPILILAENGIDHALVALAAMEVGLPVAPVSTAYARLSRDFGKLRHILDQIEPELVFVDDPNRYAGALAAVDLRGAELVAARPAPDGVQATPLAELLARQPEPAVDEAAAMVGPDTLAKILFTSGSTDQPKGVINTQAMLCSNQEAIAQVWPFLEREPPVLVDWLPWSHTFGGNHNFNMALRHGGTLVIDEGKPTPALIEATVANLRAVAPTLSFNVPRGYAMLVDRLEADPAFNRHFFSRLRMIFYAAASLPQSTWERLEALSRAARGEVVPMVSAWGLTETAPAATVVHFPIPRAGVIGLPLPGTELKLQPSAGRLAMEVRGPNVTPGYWRRPDLTAKAFDAEGWFRTGDAGRLEDEADPSRGVVFDGRLAENFKLATGTWVGVGALRVAALAAASPLIEDAVVTGHDRDEIGLLAFPNAAACRALCPDLPAEAPLAQVLAAPAVRDAVAAGLRRHNAGAGGSSGTVCRVLLLDEPPSIDGSEITDKGYINQRAVLTRRADAVVRLNDDTSGEWIGCAG